MLIVCQKYNTFLVSVYTIKRKNIFIIILRFFLHSNRFLFPYLIQCVIKYMGFRIHYNGRGFNEKVTSNQAMFFFWIKLRKKIFKYKATNILSWWGCSHKNMNFLGKPTCVTTYRHIMSSTIVTCLLYTSRCV